MTFYYQVLTSHPLITGSVQPSRAVLETNQTISLLLILTSQPDASLGTVTQVNVTATPASRDADVKQLDVLSLTLKIDREPPSKDEESGKQDPEKDNHLKKWQVILIISMATIAILLVTLLVILGVNRGYCCGRKRSNNAANTANINRRPVHEFDAVIALNKYAQH